MDQDHQIKEAIEKALLRDRRLSSDPIHVSVEDGTVRLSGTVQSYRRAAAAVEIAAIVPGVCDVVNALVVEPPGNLSDREVIASVRAALDAHADVVKGAITVEVQNGIAILEGSVCDGWHFCVAEDVARSARGIREVQNRIVIDPDELVTDDEISHDIEMAIHQLCGACGDNVRAATCSGYVTLSGTVPALPYKEMAQQVARRIGILHVRNDIKVVSRGGLSPRGPERT